MKILKIDLVAGKATNLTRDFLNLFKIKRSPLQDFLHTERSFIRVHAGINIY